MYKALSVYVCVSVCVGNSKCDCLQIFRVAPEHPGDGFRHNIFSGCG